MKTRLVAVIGSAGCCIGGLSGVAVQQLVVNGDFETLALDEVEQPLRRRVWQCVPVDWYRRINTPPAVPYTELIGPENGDPGHGLQRQRQATPRQSIPGNLASHSDWRSAAVATTPSRGTILVV